MQSASTPNTNSKSLEHRRPSDGPKLKLNFINLVTYVLPLTCACFSLEVEVRRTG